MQEMVHHHFMTRYSIYDTNERGLVVSSTYSGLQGLPLSRHLIVYHICHYQDTTAGSNVCRELTRFLPCTDVQPCSRGAVLRDPRRHVLYMLICCSQSPR